MPLEAALRAVHVAAGFAGLVLGPVVLAVRKRRGIHTRLGELYFASVTVVCATSVLIALQDWKRLWLFFAVGTGTYAIALPGYLAAKLRLRRWILFHAVGQASSYVALLSAFIVNNLQPLTGLTGIPFAVRALVPMFIGTCLVAWLAWQVHLGKRPKL